MANKSAARKHKTTAGEHQAELVKMIHGLSHAHHPHEIFSDFVELSALSISNAVDRVHYEKREARYLDIVGKYTKEEVAVFPQMLGQLVLCYEDRIAGSVNEDSGLPGGGLGDVLGSLYMMLELGNDRTGQFFTPFEVSKMMAMILVGDGSDVKRKGFVSLNEPACGAGGMVIAYADALLGAGINYQKSMHAICVDIDSCLRAREKRWTSAGASKGLASAVCGVSIQLAEKWTDRPSARPSSAARFAWS